MGAVWFVGEGGASGGVAYVHGLTSRRWSRVGVSSSSGGRRIVVVGVVDGFVGMGRNGFGGGRWRDELSVCCIVGMDS